MDSYIQAAFETVCTEAKEAKGYYVALMQRSPYYGGPEEGGWWGEDYSVVAYQYFATEEEAEAARVAVVKLADELSEKARAEYGEQCLREMDWCDARGLDADYLPEVDGEEGYYVTMTEGMPQGREGCRQWS